eukprot:1137992-Pelagomonas_calceolata.AAC.5
MHAVSCAVHQHRHSRRTSAPGYILHSCISSCCHVLELSSNLVKRAHQNPNTALQKRFMVPSMETGDGENGECKTCMVCILSKLGSKGTHEAGMLLGEGTAHAL